MGAGDEDRTSLQGKPDGMPPWFLEKNVGIQQYKGDISLSDEEIAKIAKWADSGAPRGNPADMPPPLTFLGADEWKIGTPDLIVTSPSFAMKGTAPDWWGPIGETPTGLTEDRYVAAVEMKEVSQAERKSDRQTIGGLYIFHHLIWSAIAGERRAPSDAGQGGRFTRSGVMPTSSIPTRAGCSRPVRSSCSRRRTCTRQASTRKRRCRSASSSIRRATSRRRRSSTSISPRRWTSTSGRSKPTRRSKRSPR